MVEGPIVRPANTQKLILIAMTIAGGVTLIEEVGASAIPGDKAPTNASVGSIVIGTFVAGALLLGMSYFIPEFASGLAIVVMTSTVFTRGKVFWDLITLVTGGKPAASTTGNVGADIQKAGANVNPSTLDQLRALNGTSGGTNPPLTTGKQQ